MPRLHQHPLLREVFQGPNFAKVRASSVVTTSHIIWEQGEQARNNSVPAEISAATAKEMANLRVQFAVANKEVAMLKEISGVNSVRVSE